VDGATGDVACDHYHRWEEDLDLMARLAIDTYRFSVSWPRVQPDGKALNPKGLDFYDRLVDGLLQRGIAPALTLYHWDHPQALEERGGWLDRDLPHRFADYATVVGERLGDRVGMWITINEPLSVMMSCLRGYRSGGPLTLQEGLRLGHHLLLGHGLALERLREAGVAGPAGIVLNLSGMRPASDSSADRQATARAQALEDRLFLEPILLGRYPEGLVDSDGDDLRIISSSIDFLGVNWYAPARIEAAPDNIFGYRRTAFRGALTNMLGWPVLPDEFGTLLSWLRQAYPGLPPVYITENGLPLPDRVGPDGAVRDPLRVDYMNRCLAQIQRAIAAGMDIRGYFAWSLLDNLEWEHGFGPRFGLTHVDFGSLTRTPKESFLWYQETLAAVRRSWRR
jgi:beta-glucosidase